MGQSEIEHPKIARARANAEASVRVLEERIAAGECARAMLFVETLISVDGADEDGWTRAEVFAAKKDGKGDAYAYSGAPDTLAASFDRRVKASRQTPRAQEIERRREEMSATAVDSASTLPPLGDAQAVLARLERELATRVAKSPRAGALRAESSVTMRVTWRFWWDPARRAERTDVAIVAAVHHRVPVTNAPPRLYGEELTAADLEESVGATRHFNRVPADEELDALVAEARAAKSW
jgi:hypothetical protein